MLYQYHDGVTFVDEVEAYQQLYPFGMQQEDPMAVHAMPAHGKQSHYEVFDMNQFNHNAAAQYLPQSYESPLTDQNDLAALPTGYAAEYDEGLYLHNPAEQYCSSTVVPSNPGNYSAGPLTVSAPIQSQPAARTNVQSSKKRKASIDSFDGEAPRPKRIAVALQDPNGEYYDLKSESSPYSSLVPTPTAISAFHIPHQHTTSPRLAGHQHSTSNVSQMSVPATAPYTPTVSPSFTTANTEHSPRAPATPGPRSASAASNPKLVRTSTMPQHSPRVLPPSMTIVGHTQTFNPYALYSPDSKARLHLEGSLDDVAKDWSEEELEARRKIVVFERDQKGNDIFTDFKVVSQEDWKNHSRSVSCIWWAEKKEAYVTSVDTISLLEGIVAARFTVEEKNRIRRNLEGFKPDTVSKAKPETEEFFKVIMGFPNPKPRNIEKDVKVFPWKVLSVALQKIISKYSASYASTAASISTHPKIYRPIEHPAEFRYSNSPGPEYHVGTPQLANFPTYEAHRVPMPINSVTNMQMAHQVGYGHEPHPGYSYGHVQMPQQQQPQQHHHHHHQQHPQQQQQQQQHQQQQHQQQQQQQQHQVHYHAAPMTAPPVPQAQYWHYPAYTMEAQIPMAPASAPPTAYPREMIETGDYRHVPYSVHAAHH